MDTDGLSSALLPPPGAASPHEAAIALDVDNGDHADNHDDLEPLTAAEMLRHARAMRLATFLRKLEVLTHPRFLGGLRFVFAVAQLIFGLLVAATVSGPFLPCARNYVQACSLVGWLLLMQLAMSAVVSVWEVVWFRSRASFDHPTASGKGVHTSRRAVRHFRMFLFVVTNTYVLTTGPPPESCDLGSAGLLSVALRIWLTLAWTSYLSLVAAGLVILGSLSACMPLVAATVRIMARYRHDEERHVDPELIEMLTTIQTFAGNNTTRKGQDEAIGADVAIDVAGTFRGAAAGGALLPLPHRPHPAPLH